MNPAQTPPPFPHEPHQKKSGCGKMALIGLGLVVALFVVGFVVLAAIGGMVEGVSSSFASRSSSFSIDGGNQEVVVEDGSSGNQVLILDIEGVISSEGGPDGSMIAVAREQLRQVRSNPDILGVLIRVNSPGGGVTASDQIYEEVMKTKAAGKKVLVFMDEIAASGGYYIACGADHIVATPTTITGSIGVIISSINATGLMDKIGVQPQVFTSGEFKDTLSISREMRPDEQAYIQAMVEESYDRFVGLVSEGRGIAPAELNARKLVDGRIFSGTKAAELGLVDQVGYWDDAVASMRELVGDEDAELVRWVPEVDFLEVISMFGMKASDTTVKVELSPSFTLKLKPGIPYALPAEYVGY